MLSRRGLQCPSCGNRVVASREIFSEGLHCVQCGRLVHVPIVYTRTLVVLSGVIGLVLLWLAGARSVMTLSLLYLPVGFLVATVVVPTALIVAPPKLAVGRPPGQFTTLGLGREDEDRHN